MMELVYLARLADGTLKIGSSRNLDNRVKNLRTVNKQGVEILYVVPGYRELEDHLHTQFEAHRIHRRFKQTTYQGETRHSNYRTDYYRPCIDIVTWFRENGTEWQMSDQSAIRARVLLIEEREALLARLSEIDQQLEELDA